MCHSGHFFYILLDGTSCYSFNLPISHFFHLFCHDFSLSNIGKRKMHAQSVTCLTADPGAVSLIRAGPILISMAVLLPSADSRRVIFIYKRKYVHKVLVNCLVKLVQEQVWLGELTAPT